MKILAAGDMHADFLLMRELAERAKKEKVDVVALCGDITWADEGLEGLIGPFKEANCKVLLIPGNHETPPTIDFLAELYSPGVYNLHGKGVKIGGIGFFGCGAGNIGVFRLSEEEIRELLMKAHMQVKDAKKKVMLTHVPPLYTKVDRLLTISVGSKAVREVIEEVQPDIAFCCHLHETFGICDRIGKTKVINVGRRGKIVRL